MLFSASRFLFDARIPEAKDDKLVRSLASDYQSFCSWQKAQQARWLDLFIVFPSLLGRISPEVFYQLAAGTRPRFYSISSSNHTEDGHVAITVRRLEYELPSGDRRHGHCSAFLTGVAPGARVGFRIMPTPHFRLPLDLRCTVVMIGAGTGIAPFRGFWQELMHRHRKQPKVPVGNNMLFYGCRDPDKDYLFKVMPMPICSRSDGCR